MDIDDRQAAWWRTLSDQERSYALKVTDDVPKWMADSLVSAEIIVIEADMDGHSTALLMPTSLREFLDRRSRESQNNSG